MAAVQFFSQGISFKLKDQKKVIRWVNQTIKAEGAKLGSLNFIFCSDQYLADINRQYLNHNTFTDIITFDNSEDQSDIEGDIFISIERVKENAQSLDLPFIDELHRVLIHGVLHLLGYSDKRPSKKKEMRGKEDAYLSLRAF